MTNPQPPRLALSWLARVLPEDDPLIGDLLEEFHAGRTSFWFWRQTVSAVVAAWRRPSPGVRPLTLVDDPSRIDFDPRPDWPTSSGGPLAYLSASPVTGVGGLGLLAVIVLTTLVTPQIWMFVAVALPCGAALGAVLARRHARRLSAQSPGAIGHILFEEGDAVARDDADSRSAR